MRLVLTFTGPTDHDAGVKIAKAKPYPSSAANVMNFRHVQQHEPILIASLHAPILLVGRPPPFMNQRSHIFATI